MPYKDGQQTLLGFISSPFMDSIARKPLFGGPYARGVDYLGIESQLYQIGAALGHALQNKLYTLVKLLFVPGTESQKINEVVRLCKKDAEKNLREYENEFGQEPNTFDDFAFYWWIGNLVKTVGIRISPREAFKAYLSGDKKVKRLFDTKVDTEGMGQRIMTMLLEGIYFGSTFPKLTEKMFQNACEDDKDFWTGAWELHNLTISEKLRVKSLKETEKAVLQMVALYTSKYYPELVDPLDLRSYLDVEKIY